MGQRTDRIFGAKPVIIGKSAPVLAEITIRKSQKRGVGLETISEFCVRLHLETQVGCSPSAVRGIMQTLEAMILETAAAWEQDGIAAGKVRDIIGAVDETFLEYLLWPWERACC